MPRAVADYGHDRVRRNLPRRLLFAPRLSAKRRGAGRRTISTRVQERGRSSVHTWLLYAHEALPEIPLGGRYRVRAEV